MKNLVSIAFLAVLGLVAVGCGSAPAEETAVDKNGALPVQGTPRTDKPVVGAATGGGAPASTAAPATAPEKM